MRTLLYATTGLVAAGLALAMPHAAQATPMTLTLTADDITASVTQTAVFTDAGTPNTINVPSGSQGPGNTLVFNGELSTSTIGGVNILATTALTVANISTTDTYVLTASLVGQNFSGPVNQVTAAGSGTFNTTNAANQSYGPITYTYFDDPGNTGVPGAGNEVATFTFSGLSGFDQGFGTSQTSGINPPDGATYGMSEEWTYTLLPGQELISRGLSETKVEAPEPASLLLLGVGALGAGLVSRRRRI